jgi:hypothetical protein
MAKAAHYLTAAPKMTHKGMALGFPVPAAPRLDARKEEVVLREEAEAFLEEALEEAFRGQNLARALPEPRLLPALRDENSGSPLK